MLQGTTRRRPAVDDKTGETRRADSRDPFTGVRLMGRTADFR
jgi:hypothetical protein